MKRRVTIVYNPVQPGTRHQHHTLHQPPSTSPPAPHQSSFQPTTLASSSAAPDHRSLCLSCMATSSSSPSAFRFMNGSSSPSPSPSPSSSASFPCQRCCSISSILKSSPASSPSPLSASEKAAQLEDALNNNHHHQHHKPSTDGCCASVAECTTGRRRASHPASDRGDEQRWCMYLLVGLIATLCYLNGIQGDFVHDDIPAITLNKDVLGTGPVAQVFRNDFWGTPMADLSSHKSYRPLTTLTFRGSVWANL
uniref:Uncharacterized protein n=1 Tax=Anopheles merus TaxID=30066 RepID=A0A182V544_ANOME